MSSTENKNGKIYQAIPAIMGEIDAIGKNKRNTQQGFMYRGIDDVMNAINPSLVKHGVFIVPEIMEQSREERQTNKGSNLIYSICRIRFRFYAEDGSSIEAITVGEGMDSGDKATNKAMAVAFKYACFQVFCIPTEEMKDPDAESYELAEKDKNMAETNFYQESKEMKEHTHQQEEKMKSEANASFIDQAKITVIQNCIYQKGLKEKSVLDNYGIQCFEEMKFEQWENAMKILAKYKDKELK